MVFMCYDNKQGVALLPELFSGLKAFIDMKEHLVIQEILCIVL